MNWAWCASWWCWVAANKSEVPSSCFLLYSRSSHTLSAVQKAAKNCEKWKLCRRLTGYYWLPTTTGKDEIRIKSKFSSSSSKKEKKKDGVISETSHNISSPQHINRGRHRLHKEELLKGRSRCCVDAVEEEEEKKVCRPGIDACDSSDGLNLESSDDENDDEMKVLQPPLLTKEMKVDIAVALVHWATTTTRIYLFSEVGVRMVVMMTTKTTVVVVHWSEVKSTTTAKNLQPISKCKRRSTEVCVFVCKSSSPQSQTVTSRLEHDDDHQSVCVCVCASLDVCRCRLELAVRRQQTHYQQCGCRWAKSTYAHLLLGG